MRCYTRRHSGRADGPTLRRLFRRAANPPDYTGGTRGAHHLGARASRLALRECQRLAWPHPDAELLALADQYAVAYNRYSDLSRTVDRMDEAARGYQKANRKLDSAERAYRRIEDRIADIRANTTEGMLAKVKCAQAYNETEKGFRFEEGGCPEVMAQSIFLDVLRMTGTAV